jgi:hypothetical protein
MADSLHMSIAGFRETMLTALAKLEFQLRDTAVQSAKYSIPAMSTIATDEYEDCGRFEIAKLTSLVSQLSTRIASLEEEISKRDYRPSYPSPPTPDPMVSELLNMRPPSNTRNILVSSVRSTPALAAAVAAATVPALDLAFTAGDAAENTDEESTIDHTGLDHDEDVEMEVVEEEQQEEHEDQQEEQNDEGDVEEGDSESSGPDLKPIKIDGKQYYIDEEQNVYSETMDGYEQVGIFDSKTKKLVVEEESNDEDNEAEEEGIVVEDFVYKGKTYQRDEEGNVYLDGEQIGTWNGKRIVA